MKIFTTIFAFILLSASVIAQVSEVEKQALLDLYVSTDGNSWNNTWDVNTPVKEWYGVTVEDNKITQINLMFNNLKGELPSSLSVLSQLENLELSFNQIEGTIPASFGDLESLKSFAINSNRISGSIPSSSTNQLPFSPRCSRLICATETSALR